MVTDTSPIPRRTRKALERRRAVRYHIKLPLHYSAVLEGSAVRSGHGVTADMSRRAVRFSCDAPLPVGASVKLSIEWPSAEKGRPLVLRTVGYILRAHAREVVALISRHQLGPALSMAARQSAQESDPEA